MKVKEGILPEGFRLLARIDEARAAIAHILEEGYDHWIINFSGGKDSTATVVVTLEMALECIGEIRRIDVVYADTMLEIPSIKQYALSFLSSLQTISRLTDLPLHCHVVLPRIEERYWVYLLGRGYPPPHQRFRWCTRRLKVQPIEDKLKQFTRPNRTSIITGVRFGESKDRDKRLVRSCTRGGECGQGLWMQYSRRLEATYLAPLVDWSDCDVWDFLLLFAPSLGYPTAQLERVYNGRETRFGCWMCTVVRQDKAMEKTIAQAEWSYLAPLAELRNHVWEVTRPIGTRELRADGRPGRLQHWMRESLLKDLLHTERQAGVSLITADEVEIIEQMWRKEGHYE